MARRTWLRSGKPQLVVLWGLSVLFVALALADVVVLGLDPAMLAVLAAVFAAVTSAYTWGSNADETGSQS